MKNKRKKQRKHRSKKNLPNSKPTTYRLQPFFRKMLFLIVASTVLGIGLYAFTQKSNVHSSISKSIEGKTEDANNVIFDNPSASDLFLREPMYYYRDPYELLNVWLEQPIPLSTYSEKAINWQRKLNDDSVEYVLSRSGGSDKNRYINDNYNKPIGSRNIDHEDITPFTWKWVEIVVDHEDGNRLQANLRRPNWWLKHNGADQAGNSIELYMPEMGFGGKGKVTRITPIMLDTRLRNFDPDENGNVGRPITGKFERSFAEVWDFTFEHETIGSTANHPFYSEDRKSYVPVGQLRVGEQVRTKNGKSTRLLKKQKRKRPEKVYNLEIWRDHNFHVGRSGILVHNDCRVSVAKITDEDLTNVFGSQAAVARERLSKDLGDSDENLSSLYDFFINGLPNGVDELIRATTIRNRLNAWRVLVQSNVTETIRLNTENLEFLSDYLRRFPNDDNRIVNNIRNSVNRQSFIDLFKLEDQVNISELVIRGVYFTEIEHIPWAKEFAETFINQLEKLRNEVGDVNGRFDIFEFERNIDNATMASVTYDPVSKQSVLEVNLGWLEKFESGPYGFLKSSIRYEGTSGAFVHKSIEDLVNHEFGHLLTTETADKFDVDKKFSEGSVDFFEALDELSFYASYNGYEALAEIFTAHKQGRTIPQVLKDYFNEFSPHYQIP